MCHGVDPVVRNAPLKAALAEPVESLRTGSDGGDRQCGAEFRYQAHTDQRASGYRDYET